METRWHVPTGTKESEAKIEDRRKELHIAANRFNAITAHLERVRSIEEAHEAEETKKSAMKAASDSMTKTWSDSVQHQHDAKRAELDGSLHKEDDHNLIRFLSVKKEQDAERKIYVDKMRQKLLSRKDFPKAVGSAYLFSEVLHEREKQKEFGKLQKQHQVEEDKKFHWLLVDDSEKYVKEEEEKKKNVHEKNKAFAQELVNQVTEIQNARISERKQRIEEELVDQERASRESERIENIRLEKTERTRREAKKALLDFMEQQSKESETIIRDSEDCDVVTKIIQKSDDCIKVLMKRKDKEIMDERMALGQKAFDNSLEVKRDAELQLIYDRGVAKFEETAKLKEAELQAKKHRLRRDRQEDHKQYLLYSAAQKKHEKEILKWEMLNRFKIVEEEAKCEKYIKKQAQDKRAEIVQIYDQELKLKNERIAALEEDEVQEIVERNESDDKIYMQYAGEVKDSAEQLGWPTLPIDRIITKYKTNVMGEKRFNRCAKSENNLCTNNAHVNDEPGKRTHCPSSDPTIRCKHQKERIYK